MGCGTSATATLDQMVSPTWSNVTLNLDTGDIAVKTADGVETDSKFNLEREPESSRCQKLHFVEQKIGGTWDEVGGNVKFSCVDGPSMQKLWQEVGSTPHGSQSTTASSVSTNSLKGPSKVYKECLCNGVAHFKDQTFLMTGSLNGTIHIVEKESGEVVLTMWQSTGGSSLTFYSCLVEKKMFGKSATPEQVEHQQNAFCGMRDRTDIHGSIVNLQVKPEVLEKIPVPLFAMAVMYSSFDLNSMAL